MAIFASFVFLVIGCTAALAIDDKYHITDAERSACSADAMRLCAGAYPSEDRLLGCMKSKHVQLSNECAVVFDAGVRRRKL